MEIDNVRPNKSGEAITAAAYQSFIVTTVKAAGGNISEADLDAAIEVAYRPIWGPTDLHSWGRAPGGKPKWSQNVASAKSGLDRRGIVLKWVRRYRDPEDRKRIISVPSRIYFGAIGHSIVEAHRQWSMREAPDLKPRYAKLKQPKARYLVPA